MGRNFVGFLVGLIICALVFATVAVFRVKDTVPAPAAEIAAPTTALDAEPQDSADPEVTMAEPEPQVLEQAESVVSPAAPEPEQAASEVAEATPVNPAVPVAEAESEPEAPEINETPPVVASEPAAQPAPADVPQPEPKVAEQGRQAPLQKPVALAEAPPEPAPLEPVPNPPVVIAEAEPTPEPDPAPQPETEPQTAETAVQDAVTPAEPVPEPAPVDVAPVPVEEPAPAPVVRRGRLPVVTDDTPTADIGFGWQSGSGLPSIAGDVTQPLPVVPEAQSPRAAPPPVAAKRLTAPKSSSPNSNAATILSTESDTAAAEQAPEAAPEPAPALDEFGVPFDSAAKPKLSIVLVDVGNEGVTLDTAATMDLPVTFAIAVDRPDATLAAERYFESGHEVLALSPRSVQLSLSGGQTREQVAELLQEFFDIVPQSIGLLDAPEATLQNDRVLSKYVLDALRDSGHGLVTYAQGLNAAKREADKAGVPAGLIYRSLDQKGETASDIARHLNRAVTEAASIGHVIVIGSTRAATIEAIRDWSESRTAQSVVIAPVSASIKPD